MIELRPPQSYEEVFLDKGVINGLPGPGMHRIAYSRLKERAIERLVREQKSAWRDRLMFLTGIREDESNIRMGYQSTIIDRKGAQVWVNPIYRWTNEEIRRYRGDHDLPINPVSQHIHISGECLCGAFAQPGELDQIRFFFPETAARIEGWEKTAAEKGLKYCQWGARRPDQVDDPDLSPMCRQCVGQMSLLDDEAGIAIQ